MRRYENERVGIEGHLSTKKKLAPPYVRTNNQPQPLTQEKYALRGKKKSFQSQENVGKLELGEKRNKSSLDSTQAIIDNRNGENYNMVGNS